MAKYYFVTDVLEKTGTPSIFKDTHKIGSAPSYPGIYKCQSCGYEDVINRECNKFPPCSNCSDKKGANTWKLLVQATDA